MILFTKLKIVFVAGRNWLLIQISENSNCLTLFLAVVVLQIELNTIALYDSYGIISTNMILHAKPQYTLR